MKKYFGLQWHFVVKFSESGFLLSLSVGIVSYTCKENKVLRLNKVRMKLFLSDFIKLSMRWSFQNWLSQSTLLYFFSLTKTWLKNMVARIRNIGCCRRFIDCCKKKKSTWNLKISVGIFCILKVVYKLLGNGS